MASGVLEKRGLAKAKTHPRSVQREIGRAIAGRLDHLVALHRRGLARPAIKRVVQRQDERITAAAAMTTIDAAVMAHNAALPDAPAFAIADA